MNISELIHELLKMHFLYFKPLATTWSAAFVITKHSNESLCILLRKKGIDFRYYSNSDGLIQVSPNFKVSFTGGEVFRHFYYKSDRRLTLTAYHSAKLFVEGKKDFYKLISDESGFRLKSCENYYQFRELKLRNVRKKFKVMPA